MKNPTVLFLFIPLFVFLSCKNDSSVNHIYYASINKEYVLPANLKAISGKTDPVSLHLDSIISGLINTEVISTGNISFDLNGDKHSDLSVEIIDLNKFNIHALPDTLDSLAARVTPYTLQILDNSTYGYADALNENYMINNSGNWSTRTFVLGTFLGAGQFKGKGEKYLGIRFFQDSTYLYGWIKLYCSQNNDTLRIIDYAYNRNADHQIATGQKE
jgi:hypothetical protein